MNRLHGPILLVVSLLMLGMLYGLPTCAAGINQQTDLSGTITIAGSGDSQLLLRLLAQAFMDEHPQAKVHVPESTGSSGGLKSLANGGTNLARVARPLRDHELQYNFIYTPFAYSPVVFAVNAMGPDLENITSRQVEAIYTGKITTWAELNAGSGKLYPITRESGDSSLEILLQQFPCFAAPLNPEVKILYSTPKTTTTIESYPLVLGYLPLSATVGRKIRPLSLDGVFPSQENIVSGRYKLLVPFAIVSRPSTSPLEAAFIDFLQSPKSKTIIRHSGATPVD